MVERITEVAIRHTSGRVYALPAPNRHYHIIEQMAEMGVSGKDGENTVDQGFMTNTGRYVDRDEAGRIAIASGQCKRKGVTEIHLFSEDLW